MANGWTPERRARQAELIRRWRPWEKSMGPRTEAGKANASKNVLKGGRWKLLRDLARVLREQKNQLGASYKECDRDKLPSLANDSCG